MGCITTLELDGIGLDCNDIPTGGIKNIYIANACDVILGVNDDATTADFGKVTILAFDAGKVFKLDFNKKDGVTGWSEAKTIDDTGLVTNVPTLTMEFPKMTKEKRNMINDLLNPNVSVLLFVETAADTHHILGAKYGMAAKSGAGATGTGRTEKNAYTLTFDGEESELSYDLTDKWANVVNKVVPANGGEGDYSTIPAGTVIPRLGCIPASPV